jgi:DNA (cytosine-5)-methyltransferase 1
LDHSLPWADPEWIWCQDTKWRPTEPELCPLADGIPGRVGQLRAYGNAIVPQVAAAFIDAFEETMTDVDRSKT